MRSAPAEGRDRVIVLVLAILIAALVGPHVPGFTTDSDSYLDVARSLLEGHGLTQRVVDFWRPGLPDPLGLWPPLYPMVIAGLARLGVPLERAATVVSALSFPVFALAFHALAGLVLPAAWPLAVTALACGTLAVAFASGMAWSEMLYLALSSAALLALVRVLERRPVSARERASVRLAVIAGALAGLAALTRYLGAVLLPLGLAALILRGRPRQAIAWALPALALPGLWVLHNVTLFGRPGGPGLPHAHATLVAVIAQFVPAMRWGFVPWPLDLSGATSALCVSALLVLAVLALALGGVQRLLASYVVLYLLALLVLRASLTFNAIGYRYLTPIHPFLWLCAACTLHWLTERVRFAARLTFTATILLLALTAISLGRFVMRMPAPAPESVVRGLERDELVRLLAGTEGPVLSDAGHRVRSATGRSAVQVPAGGFALRPFTADDEARWRAAGVHVAVFRREPALGGPWTEAAAMADWEQRVGPYLAARLAPGSAGRWAVRDSGEAFIRYEMPEP